MQRNQEQDTSHIWQYWGSSGGGNGDDGCVGKVVGMVYWSGGVMQYNMVDQFWYILISPHFILLCQYLYI